MKKPMRYICSSGGGYGWGEIYYDSETGKCYEESYHCECVDLSEEHYDGLAEKDKKYVVEPLMEKNELLTLIEFYATEYGELLPTVDDAVCGLISILDAMNTGDNDRFHLETLHHSKQEIRRILERGGKIDRTVEYAVDDEDEEYEQYHGFSMRM